MFQSSISFDPSFTATSILHPATYLNKVVVASSQGSLQLWNIKTKCVIVCQAHDRTILTVYRSCIHQFAASRLLSSPSLSASSSNEHGSAITALVQSPAIDVVGIGFISGEISVYDVRADERLMRMFMEGGGVRALGFRSGWYFFESLRIHNNFVPPRWPSNPCISVLCWTHGSMGSE